MLEKYDEKYPEIITISFVTDMILIYRKKRCLKRWYDSVGR